MSEQQQQPSQGMTNSQTILFMVVLSVVCALILSVLASVLAQPQEIAKDLDRSKQMMIAAKILDPNGYFLIEQDGKYIPAKETGNGSLVPGSIENIPSRNQLINVYKARFRSLLADNKGKTLTFQEAHLNEEEYLAKYKKAGYYRAPLKLYYEILPNPSEKENEHPKAIGYVIPVNGFGLWDAVYGYLALEPNADTVIGISWYDQKETPGLGANISEPSWQSQFPGKLIFQESANGKTDLATAPLGITVVKGKVSEVLGDVPKAKSAVDGMAGATLTGNGITDAYRDVLAAYRPLLVQLNAENAQSAQSTTK